jgi:hypothetical protein
LSQPLHARASANKKQTWCCHGKYGVLMAKYASHKHGNTAFEEEEIDKQATSTRQNA